MVISEVDGEFKKFSGSLEMTSDNLVDEKINIKIDPSSIDTNNDYRDKHLRSGDFFNTEKFPEISFVSKSITHVSGKMYKIVGDLTLHGITNEVTLDTKFRGKAKSRGKDIMVFSATGIVKRYDFDIKYNSAMEAGGLTLGKEITLNIKAELKIPKKKNKR